AVVIPDRLLPKDLTLDQVSPEWKPLMPLFKTKWLALESRYDEGINLVVKIKSRKEDVKQVQKAADAGLKMLADPLEIIISAKLWREDPDYKNIMKIADQLAADLEKVKVESKGDVVRVEFQTKIDADVTAGAVVEAVQKVRDAGNRSASASNLRQVVISIMYYESQTGELPQ